MARPPGAVGSLLTAQATGPPPPVRATVKPEGGRPTSAGETRRTEGTGIPSHTRPPGEVGAHPVSPTATMTPARSRFAKPILASVWTPAGHVKTDARPTGWGTGRRG